MHILHAFINNNTHKLHMLFNILSSLIVRKAVIGLLCFTNSIDIFIYISESQRKDSDNISNNILENNDLKPLKILWIKLTECQTKQ